MHYFSASQVSTFRDCKRKWAFDKIDKLPRQPNKYAQHGSALHERLETYLRFGTMPEDTELMCEIEGVKYYGKDFTAVMLPGLKYLPKPGEGTVEGKFEMELPGLGMMVGFIDLNHEENGIPVNTDHKTTSDLKWAMTEEQLREDVQSVVYAVRTLEDHPSDYVINRWVYYLRNPKKPRAKKVEVKLHLSEVDKLWQGVLEDCREMKRLHESGVKAEAVEYDVTSCDKYGGCPFRKNCNLSVSERMRSLRMQQSIKDRLKAHKAKKNPTPPPSIEGPEDIKAKPKAKGNPLAGLKAKAKLVKPVPINPPENEEVTTPGGAVSVEAKEAQKTFEAKLPVKPLGQVGPTTSTQGWTLYVGCLPSRERPLPFAELLAEANRLVEKDHGVPHYRLIPDQFGGYPAILQGYLAKVMKGRKLGSVSIDPMLPESGDALAFLQAEAYEVVRGL